LSRGRRLETKAAAGQRGKAVVGQRGKAAGRRNSDDNTGLLDLVRDAEAWLKRRRKQRRSGRPMRRSTPSWRRLAAAAAAKDSDSKISWSSDDPDAPTQEERTAEQRAIVESSETLKDDTANARLEP
jgi:hypothetical protein